MNNKLSSILMTAALAVFGTACGAEYDEMEGEGAVDSIEQPIVLPTTGLRFNITLGDNGLASGGQAYAEVRYVDAAPVWYPLNNGAAWPADSTQTVGIALNHPEDVYDVFIRYGKGQVGDHTDTWKIKGLQIHDVRNGALSTQRFQLGWDIYLSPQATFAYLPIPNVLLRAPSNDLGNQQEFFSLSYETWNGAKACMSIKDNEFLKAPLGQGCKWREAVEVPYIDYLSWDGYIWRATVNTTTMMFTHQRQNGPAPIAPPHSSTNLRYKSLNLFEMVIKPWDDDNG